MDDRDREYMRHYGGCSWQIRWLPSCRGSRAMAFYEYLLRAPAPYNVCHLLNCKTTFYLVCSTALLPGWTHMALVSIRAVANDHRL